MSNDEFDVTVVVEIPVQTPEDLSLENKKDWTYNFIEEILNDTYLTQDNVKEVREYHE